MVSYNESRVNNFDLVRAFAACQVLVWHGVEHLDVAVPSRVMWLVGSFPGVPIFFVVSGYLIAGSWQRSSGPLDYSIKRACRIFPGLWVCFVLTAIAIGLTHGYQGAQRTEIVPWVFMNAFGVAYTPGFLKSYATGSVNGSLWTIPVELQFYLLLPFLLLGMRQSRLRWTIAFLIALGSGLIYLFLLRGSTSGRVAGALGRLLLPWLYMFMLGMIVQWRADLRERWLKGKFVAWISGYLAWIFVLDQLGVSTVGNAASPLATVPLAGVAMSAAFTFPTLARRLLQGHDLSYGIYLYHMPIVNIIVATQGHADAKAKFMLAIASTMLLAGLSWWLVERPSLRLKPSFRLTSSDREDGT